MARAEDKVLDKFPNAHAKRYKTVRGVPFYFIWSDIEPVGVTLGEGKTASSAWVDAAINIEPNA